MFSGTAANAVALSMLAAPHEAVITQDQAHVVVDENGAPGFFGHGLSLTPVRGEAGRITVSSLEAALATPPAINRPAPVALSLTQATEYGALYDARELVRLVRTATDAGLRVHLDGARLANAVAAGFDPALIARSGVDTLVLGGAKAGAGCVEALVIFDKALARGIDNRLKQCGQIASKARTLTAPLLGLLESGAWVRRAAHANRMASILGERIACETPWRLAHPVQTNCVFVDLPAAAYQSIVNAGWALFQFGDRSTRLVCNWATCESDIDHILRDMSIAARTGSSSQHIDQSDAIDSKRGFAIAM